MSFNDSITFFVRGTQDIKPIFRDWHSFIIHF